MRPGLQLPLGPSCCGRIAVPTTGGTGTEIFELVQEAVGLCSFSSQNFPSHDSAQRVEERGQEFGEGSQIFRNRT